MKLLSASIKRLINDIIIFIRLLFFYYEDRLKPVKAIKYRCLDGIQIQISGYLNKKLFIS